MFPSRLGYRMGLETVTGILPEVQASKWAVKNRQQ